MEVEAEGRVFCRSSREDAPAAPSACLGRRCAWIGWAREAAHEHRKGIAALGRRSCVGGAGGAPRGAARGGRRRAGPPAPARSGQNVSGVGSARTAGRDRARWFWGAGGARGHARAGRASSASQRLRKRFQICRHVERYRRRFRRVALHHARQLLARTRFDEGRHAAFGRHPLHALAPAHPARHLLDQQAANVGRRIDRPRGDVRPPPARPAC